VQRHLQRADSPQRPDHGGPAGHVRLHRRHALRRLEVVAAGVKRHALAHQDDRRQIARPGGVVLQDDKAWRRLRSLGHGQQGVHPQRLHLAALQHLHPQTGGIRRGGRRLGQIRRRADVGRQVDQIARQRHTGDHCLGLFNHFLHGRHLLRLHHQIKSLDLGRGFFSLARGLIAVQRQPRAFDHGIGRRRSG